MRNLFVLCVLLAGCSYAFSRAPDPARPPTSCVGNGAPVYLDVVGAIPFGIVTVASAINAARDWGDPCEDLDCPQVTIAVGATAAAIATVFVLSAVHGNRHYERCETLRDAARAEDERAAAPETSAAAY